MKQNTPVDAFLTSSLGKFNKKLASQLGLIHSVVFTNFCLIEERLEEFMLFNIKEDK